MTEAQLDAFRRLAAQNKLETAALGIIIEQATGRLPTLPEGGDTGAEQAAILEFMAGLTFADAGNVIKALMALEPPASDYS